MLAANRQDVMTADPPIGAEPQLRVFARDNDTRIRFVADPLARVEGRVADRQFFETWADVAESTKACTTILERTNGETADTDGWHATPKGAALTTFLPTLLRAGRNAAWSASAIDGPEDADQAEDGAAGPPQTILMPVAARLRGGWGGQRWTLSRVAWLGFLIGLGWTAKKIAVDPLIRSTPGNIYRQARRFGLSISEAPQGQVCVDLPVATLAVIDKAAGLAHLQRDAFIKRLLIRAASDPNRFGLTVAGL